MMLNVFLSLYLIRTFLLWYAEQYYHPSPWHFYTMILERVGSAFCSQELTWLLAMRQKL